MTREEFTNLLEQLSQAWRDRRYSAAAACFAHDVGYADPLRYSFQGREALESFFTADDGCSQIITLHLTLFDESQQLGLVEYTYRGSHQYHGVALIQIRDRLISRWREYQHVSELDWETFVGATAFQNRKASSSS